MFRRILIMTCVLLLWLPLMGQSQRDSLVVSLLTCDPGPEVYELCGHEAIRIRRADAPMPAAWLANPGAELDSVWNYGTFDFAQPNFIYRFVKGETDYMVSSYPTWMFLREYEMQGRKVTEQELRLSQAEAHDLLGMLRRNALPENRTYRYNYVKDNCATRITSMLDKASARRIVYPDSINHGTFRRAMRAYHKDYPWYQFGIDLALGSGIDYRWRCATRAPLPILTTALPWSRPPACLCPALPMQRSDLHLGGAPRSPSAGSGLPLWLSYASGVC